MNVSRLNREPCAAGWLAARGCTPRAARSAGLRVLACLSLLVVTLPCAAKSYVDLDGRTCVSMQLSENGTFNFYEQSIFLPKNSSAAEQPRVKAADWAVKDNFQAHLGPAISTMNTELGQGRGGSVSANLHFTLEHFPNHPKALEVLVNYAFVIKQRPRHRPLVSPPECYLERAIDFAAKDPVPRSLYGIYLFRLKKYDLALAKLDGAAALNPTSSEINYNRGLVLFKLGRFEEAREAARKAYAARYPLPGLRRMLAAKGFDLNDGAAKVAK